MKHHLSKAGTALKHTFIPHEHNNYAPHFFREVSVAILVIAAIFLLGMSFGSSFILQRTVLGANVTADVLIDLTNESRLANNEALLSRNALLDQAATLKGNDMSANEYFSHNSPTGVTPWHWFREVGYNFLYAGENLAINFIDAKEVRDAWLASPTHRANLLDSRFKEIGMATVSGIYKSEPTIYVVQLFGTPALAKTVPDEQVATDASTSPKATIPSETPVLAIGQSGSPTQQPEIKGESKAQQEQVAEEAPKPLLSTIVMTPDRAVVKNNSAVEATTTIAPYERQAAWYEHALFGGSYYVDIVLKAIFVLVLVAFILLLAIELKKQHWKHAVYGMSVMLVLLLSIVVNQLFW